MAWVMMGWYEMESGGVGGSLEGWINGWMGLDGVGVGWNGMGMGWGGIGMVLVLSWRVLKISVNRLSSVDARVRFTCVYRTCAFCSPASDQVYMPRRRVAAMGSEGQADDGKRALCVIEVVSQAARPRRAKRGGSAKR